MRMFHASVGYRLLLGDGIGFAVFAGVLIENVCFHRCHTPYARPTSPSVVY